MKITKILAKKPTPNNNIYKPDYKPFRGYLACHKLSLGIHEQLHRKLKLTANTPLGFQFVSTKL